MTNDKLPVDVKKNIWAEAERYAEEKVKAVNEEHFNVYNAYISGATAWAHWKVAYDELRAQHDKQLTIEQELLKAAEVSIKECQEFKTVLQEFVSNHEAGLLPNRFVYEKAIKILNDGNTERNAG